MNIFLDSTSPSKSLFPYVAPGDNFCFALGNTKHISADNSADETIKAEYRVILKNKFTREEPNSKSITEKHERNLILHNLKSIPIRALFIKDQIFISQTTSIDVKLIEPSEDQVVDVFMDSMARLDTTGNSGHANRILRNPRTGMIVWCLYDVKPKESIEKILQLEIVSIDGKGYYSQSISES